MKNNKLAEQVKKYGGFIERGVARFPSPHLKEQFLKERAAYQTERDAKKKK